MKGKSGIHTRKQTEYAVRNTQYAIRSAFVVSFLYKEVQ
jgi:hypothetical protein